ncbi:hypothetical protein BH09BAC2_BH09BAC2_01360 [soil metagenome]
MRYLSVPLLIFTFISCNKKTAESTPEIFSEATYKMTVTVNWVSPQFTVPAGAHVTTITGMVHSKDTFLWKPGGFATKGLEDVAEVGNTVKMSAEIDAVISNKKALYKFLISPPSVTGTSQSALSLNTNYPLISFASMIAPSPDWFMGIHDVNLYENNKWKDELTVNIFTYDAGTEDGNVFGYDNPDTFPQQPIILLTPSIASVLANGNTSIGPMATVKFTKIN